MAPVVVSGILGVDFSGPDTHCQWLMDRDPGWLWWAQRTQKWSMVCPWLAGLHSIFFMCAFSLGQSVAPNIMKVHPGKQTEVWGSFGDLCVIIYVDHFSSICVTGQAHLLFFLCPHWLYSARTKSVLKLMLTSQMAQANSVLPEDHHMLKFSVCFRQIVLYNKW